jgi:transketolase
MLDSETNNKRPTVQAPFAIALETLIAARDDVVVLSADVSRWTDVLSFATAHPDRFVQVGMAEQNMVGIAAGLAKSGWLPIVVAFGVFATRRAYDQIAMSLATRPCRAIIAGFLPGIESRFRGTHQAIDDLAIMRSLPGLTVIDPCDATELVEAVMAAADWDGVVYLRCSRGKVERLFDPKSGAFEIGAARLLRRGSGTVAAISTGAATRWTSYAIELLEHSSQAEVSHLHVPTLKPFPTLQVVEFCRAHRRVVTIENHLLHGGLGASVAVGLAEAGISVPFERRGIDDRWGCYGRPEFSRQQLGLDEGALARLLDYRTGTV